VVDRLSWWLAPLFLLALGGYYLSQGTGPLACLLRLVIAIGMALALKATRWLAQSDRWRVPLMWLGGTSFFVFAVHEPLVTLGKKLAFRLLPLTAGTVLTTYALLPLLIVGLALAAYWVLQKTVPGILRVATGGR